MDTLTRHKPDSHEKPLTHPGQGRRGPLGLLVQEGTFANIFIVLTGGAFLTGLAIMLGAGDFELGLLAAAPFLLQCAQLLSPIFFRGYENLKKRLGLTLAASRLLWLSLVPLLLLEGSWRLPVLIVVVVVSSLLTMAATPAWLAWMARIVPMRVRGRFFSRRNAAIAAITLVATIVGSLVLDWSRSSGAESTGFIIVIMMAVAGATLAWRAMARIPETVKRSALKHRRLGWKELSSPFRNRAFWRLLVVFASWNGAVGLSAAFFAPHMLLNLRMSFFLIGVYSSSTALVAVVASRYWGRLIDRFGSRAVLNLCAFGIGLIPLVWLFPRADFLWVLIPEALYSGVLWAGFNLAAFTLPLDRSPQEDRTVYLSVFAAVTGIAFFLTSLLSGYIAELLTVWSVTFAGQTFINYHVLFAGSAVLRLLTAGLIMAFREPTEARLPVVVQLMGYAVLKRLSVGRQILPFAAEAMIDNGNKKITKTDAIE